MQDNFLPERKLFGCPCKDQNSQKSMITCPSCGSVQHRDCMKDFTKLINYQCPNCQLKESDFYIKVLYNIMQPTLIKHDKNNILQKMIFSFNKDFQSVFDYNLKHKTQNPKYIMIRCLRLDSEGYEHHWPFNFSISLNGTNLKVLTLPKYPPRSRSRADHPLTFYFNEDDISPDKNYHNLHKDYYYPAKINLNLVPHQQNILDLKIDYGKNDNDIYSYFISIDYVEVIKDREDAISSIKIVDDLEKLKSYFPNNTDCDEIFLSERVNLIDCYTRSQKIKLPVRSINCYHMGVFDLGYYLAINRKNKSYNCPLCKTRATRLYVDGFILNFMKENPNIEEILLSQNYIIDTQNTSKQNLISVKSTNKKHSDTTNENTPKDSKVVEIDTEMDDLSKNPALNLQTSVNIPAQPQSNKSKLFTVISPPEAVNAKPNSSVSKKQISSKNKDSNVKIPSIQEFETNLNDSNKNMNVMNRITENNLESKISKTKEKEVLSNSQIICEQADNQPMAIQTMPLDIINLNVDLRPSTFKIQAYNHCFRNLLQDNMGFLKYGKILIEVVNKQLK